MVGPRAFHNWVCARVTSFYARLIHFFRIFFHPLDISFELLVKSTSFFGYNPRLCFSSAVSAQELKENKDAILSQFRTAAHAGSDISQVLNSSRKGDSDVSGSIFEISPINKFRLFAQCNFVPVSRWALDHLLETYETRQADAVASFYHFIAGLSDTALLWGHVYERQVLSYLGGAVAEHKFPIRRLASTEQMTWTYRGRTPRFYFLQKSDFTTKIAKAVQNKTPLHLVPSAHDFPAVDSIFYDPNDSEVLTCIQVTICREHHILVSGLRRIQSWLSDTPLMDLRASKERPWRFIFIVPSGEASFELQRLEGDTTKGEWAGKVHQYVLGLDVFRQKPT
jgi:hypothetical protein